MKLKTYNASFFRVSERYCKKMGWKRNDQSKLLEIESQDYGTLAEIRLVEDQHAYVRYLLVSTDVWDEMTRFHNNHQRSDKCEMSAWESEG